MAAKVVCLALHGMVAAALASAAWAPQTPDCEKLRQRFEQVKRSVSAKTAVERYGSYMRYLNTLPDGPDNCVSDQVRQEIGQIERTLVELRIEDRDVFPAKVMHCIEIASPSQRCKGRDADDTALVPESDLTKVMPRIPPDMAARFVTKPGYRGRILGAYGGSRSQLQDHGDPVELTVTGSTIGLQKLRKIPDPVLIVLFEERDTRELRKLVWFLSARDEAAQPTKP